MSSDESSQSQSKPPTGATPEGDQFEALRDRIKQSIDDMEVRRKHDQFKNRIQLARQGMSHYESGNYADAVKFFLQYLRVLEDWKKVGTGGRLSPALFSGKEDKAELLLLTGIFWDLAKLYDRTDSKKSYGKLVEFLNQFVNFAMGSDYQPLAAESLRKYLLTNKAIHRSEFQGAYNKIKTGNCFVATTLAPFLEDEFLDGLRRMRDQKWRPTFLGRKAIWIYNWLGPVLAYGIGRLPWRLQAVVARFLRNAVFLVFPRF